jgi:hypothetical protein
VGLGIADLCRKSSLAGNSFAAYLKVYDIVKNTTKSKMYSDILLNHPEIIENFQRYYSVDWLQT